ncbi:MAG: hypothetical protein V1495_09430 [Pseudomonadota bacterium]
MAWHVLSPLRSPAIRIVVLMVVSLAPTPLAAWGSRGHQVVCDVAVRLLESEDLRWFLQNRGAELGDLCDVPDSRWRRPPYDTVEAEEAHSINPELMRTKLADLPLDFASFWSLAVRAKVDPPARAGSLWWRADQFYRLALADARRVKISSREADIADFVVDLALLGHFVGDGSMPYHVTAEFNGRKTGHSGIHIYYEVDLINAQPLNLPMSVFREAGKQKPKPIAASADFALRLMQSLSLATLPDIPEIEKGDDRVIFDRSGKNPERFPAPKVVDAFGDLPVRELARGAAYLAAIWDRIYVEGGIPSLASIRSLHHARIPSFVPLDYMKGSTPKPGKKKGRRG